MKKIDDPKKKEGSQGEEGKKKGLKWVFRH